VEDFRGGEIEGRLEMKMVEFIAIYPGDETAEISINPEHIDNFRGTHQGWCEKKINEALAGDHCFGCCHESDPVPFTTNSDDGPWFAEGEGPLATPDAEAELATLRAQLAKVTGERDDQIGLRRRAESQLVTVTFDRDEALKREDRGTESFRRLMGKYRELRSQAEAAEALADQASETTMIDCGEMTIRVETQDLCEANSDAGDVTCPRCMTDGPSDKPCNVCTPDAEPSPAGEE
jgi:hypothetical protein